MTEKISDQEIITRLQEVESSLWGTLLEKQTLNPQDLSELVQDRQYMAAHQRVTNPDRFDPEQSWEDEQITLLYHRINEMLDAIPAIQRMQDVKEKYGELSAKIDFDTSSFEIQKSVKSVLERARSKLYDVRTEYASFGETSGDQAGPTAEVQQSNQSLGLQLKGLLTLLSTASLPTGAKKPPLAIVQLIPANPRAKTLEEPLNQSNDVLERMKQAAGQAAGAFGGVFQNLINRFMGGGRDHTQ